MSEHLYHLAIVYVVAFAGFVRTGEVSEFTKKLATGNWNPASGNRQLFDWRVSIREIQNAKRKIETIHYKRSHIEHQQTDKK